MTLSTLHTISTHKKYRELLAEWEAEQSIHDEPHDDQSRDQLHGPESAVLVAFRTRPPLDGEVELFDAPLDDEDSDEENATFNVKVKPERVVPKVPAQRAPEEFMCGVTAQRGRMVVHVPNMTWKGAGLLHKAYAADLSFGPDATNADIYEGIVKTPRLVELALGGGVACVLAYGQTSAGKTYSIHAIELALALDLFSAIPADGQVEVHATFLELMGNKARDLADPGEGKDVELRQDDTGNVRPAVQSIRVRSARELEDLVGRCLGHRRTAQTSRNAKSSRSHAILSLRILNVAAGTEGELILVDLAGSERHADSKKHSPARLAETRDNNRSLLALKDCVRARASGASLVPFRTSKLTLLLKVRLSQSCVV
ncbi:P-loop containing nucleoside triphosphate hydrolase protein [Exidia glandulosa HHB12029]|uniref:Kinesin-like protein n=1 Tax=Exidia glandulosa HHB12029 TaxID=1314781 RepID=A0A166BC77_EXIGL|nr:P-loop containing nucleoside triphosphate hydrolase protein [Exidia glandulosa HHB12029]